MLWLCYLIMSNTFTTGLEVVLLQMHLSDFNENAIVQRLCSLQYIGDLKVDIQKTL